MVRRFIVLVAAVSVAGAFLALAPRAEAAPRGVVCSINGTATISPGLTTAAKNQSVTLTGVKLTNCYMGSSTSPGVPKATTGSVAFNPNPVQGKGASCAKSGLNNVLATITWKSGKTTTVKVSTTSVTGETVIQGNVTGGTETTLKKNDLVRGDVVFRPATTAMNCATVPVTKVTFTGEIAAGAPN